MFEQNLPEMIHSKACQEAQRRSREIYDTLRRILLLLMVKKSGSPVEYVKIQTCIYGVLYIQGGAGFLPSRVAVGVQVLKQHLQECLSRYMMTYYDDVDHSTLGS